MGILDGIVEWIAEQVMYGLDLINTSVLERSGLRYDAPSCAISPPRRRCTTSSWHWPVGADPAEPGCGSFSRTMASWLGRGGRRPCKADNPLWCCSFCWPVSPDEIVE
ncbi:MAG: hypothetical protein ACLU3I_20985 [Acutalibacteraceae bacterium]